ncbi:helix-turn-helix domain-containing protein [Streptomyces sp. NPDC127068]|uniref:helix-turn-helix domain-containing protein n=1 Tax=Streptomyces sp. NPDC127068 TaxID=3347127 RepID=UPI00364DBF56
MVNLTPFRNRRTELGLTYQEVAARCGRAESTAYRWLNGDSEMSVRDVIDLGHALLIPYPDLVENLKGSVEARALTAEYHRVTHDRTGTIRNASEADTARSVFEYRRAKPSHAETSQVAFSDAA